MSDYWKDNNIEKPQSIIVCAANRFGEVIICGARHWDVRMRQQAEMMGGSKFLRTLGTEEQGFIGIRALADLFEEQGFIDQYGDYYDRITAMKIVKESGQPFNIKRNGGDIALFSEGIC